VASQRPHPRGGSVEQAELQRLSCRTQVCDGMMIGIWSILLKLREIVVSSAKDSLPDRDLQNLLFLLQTVHRARYSSLNGERIRLPKGAYLLWLSEIKAGGELNIRILTESAYPTEGQAAIHIARLKNYLGELNKKIDSELNKISLLREAIKRKTKPR